MQIEYLRNHPELVKTVSEWIYHEFAEPAGVTFRETHEKFSQTGINLFPITFIAVQNQDCAGTVSLFENDLKTQWALTPWLASLYVFPQYRNQGVARELIQHALNKAEEMGYGAVFLRTEQTAEYYKKMGWKFVYRAQDEKAAETEVYRYDLK